LDNKGFAEVQVTLTDSPREGDIGNCIEKVETINGQLEESVVLKGRGNRKPILGTVVWLRLSTAVAAAAEAVRSCGE
jgi:hypothetical protein